MRIPLTSMKQLLPFATADETLLETAPQVSVDQVLAATAAKLVVAPNVRAMKI